MKKYKKIKNSEMTVETFETKNYVKQMTTYDARIMFKYRSKMIQYIKMNFKNDGKYSKELWKCNQCGKIDTQQHVLWCIGFSHLREDKNLASDKDLVQYLHKVHLIREKLERKKPRESVGGQ